MMVQVNVENLKKIRIQNGFTMHGLSKKAGLGKNAISQIENNQVSKSSFIRIKAIAQALNVDCQSLIKSEEV